MTPRRWLAAGVGAVLVLIAFLLFRPDTLVTEVETTDALEDAFTTTSSMVPATTIASELDEPTTTISVPAQPVRLTAGQFTGIDHSAVGTAAVYEQRGRYVLRFEDDTDIQNGPDLYVWVLPEASYEGGDPNEYLDLGTLKGTTGGQNYDLPAEFDPALHRAVLIWCLRFSVPFAVAPLG